LLISLLQEKFRLIWETCWQIQWR